MTYLMVILLILLIIFGPQYWVNFVFKKYDSVLYHMPGNGKQLTEHLLSYYKFREVQITSSTDGDYFNPKDLTLNLHLERGSKNTLTSIVVAAHEVGHVIQYYENNIWFKLRQQLAKSATSLNKVSSVFILLIPFVTLITRSPTIGFLFFLFGFSGMILNVLLHLVTLPVEFDASFNKALPILKSGEYITTEQEKAAKQILQAAALTYISAALANLLNIGRWLTALRR